MDNQYSPKAVTTVWPFDDAIKLLGMGTGFFYVFSDSKHEYVKYTSTLITNKHVIDGAKYVAMLVNDSDNNKHLYVIELKAQAPKHQNLPNYFLAANDMDVVCIPLLRSSKFGKSVTDVEVEQYLSDAVAFGAALNNLVASNPPHNFASHNRIGSGWNLWHPNHKSELDKPKTPKLHLIGHPDGFIDASTLSPIYQECIAASNIKSDWNRKPEFIIDKPIFGGASGSPVFIVNDDGHHLLVGIVYAGTDPEVVAGATAVQIPMLGHCIRASVLDQFQLKFEELQNAWTG